MAEIPEVEGEVLLTNKKFPSVMIKRGEETLPCYHTHIREANQWVREDVLVIAETLAWCPCGKVYKRKKPLTIPEPKDPLSVYTWQCIGHTE
ncbi:hypothetical protein LCGC14_2314470 [marine sediment metagenome]|uniref:Uncharacterized protein n=1 Tax=marine sediment metagenome TaxID=412755 RepID=A0A0F9CJP2_9ZZZZ